ncbi:MAG TPA: hypothetical protein DD670_18390 [Planctomycetaceae bacterium]|nr:hypothetical protein [Planctomycetaceae bacterium]
MVKKLRCQATMDPVAWARVAVRTVIVALLGCCLAGVSPAAQDEVHYLHQGVMPPGAIGSVQLQRGGPLPGYFQPVEIKAPAGVAISLAVGNTFDEPTPAPLRLGMLIGQVYRIRVTQIPLAEGVEVFPTIEVIDRLYTPREQQNRFAIPIELTQEDLELASQGKFVTRVIYLEDPLRALPVAQSPEGNNWLDVEAGGDPLAAADALGRPVAILRMGARLPNPNDLGDAAFYFGSPPLQRYPARVARPAAKPAAPRVSESVPARSTTDRRADRRDPAETAGRRPEVKRLPAPPSAAMPFPSNE